MYVLICVSGLVLVLPTFELKLNPSKSFFYVDDESLKVDIEAT